MQNIDVNKIIEMLTYNEKDPLLFNSAFFLFFFFFFLMSYLLFIKTKYIRIYILTIFSLYFFYKTCGWYVVFILISAIFDFNISRFIFSTSSNKTRKTLLIGSIILNLGLLFFFKYTNFFIELINDIGQSRINPLKLILPVGISFYTFENLSYTIDVYDKKVEPVKKLIDYLFFLSFFPKLMMGPIVRASDFIPQIYKRPFVNQEHVGKGLYLITSGIVKKVLISDYINANYVTYIFDNPSAHTGIECLLALYGYAMVIYCDFSGYSDMAIGIAKWVGFDININFLSPYQSSSITMFWKRWHISLSTWLRDYLYIRWLNGNRKGKIRRYMNLILTMLLGGFWHGASWNFILWGGLHGFVLIIDKIRENLFIKINFSLFTNSILKYLGVVLTFNFVCFCWIFFRCTSFNNSISFITQIIFNFRSDAFLSLIKNYQSVFIVLAIAFILHFVPIKTELAYQKFLIKLPLPIKILYLVVCILLVIQFKQSESIKPIYLQF